MQTTLRKVVEAICSNLNLSYLGGSGIGSFKETYHVLSEAGENIALKVFKSANANERTSREIDAMKVCEHHNIARLLEVTKYEYDGQSYLYLLEEYLSGGTLSEKLQKSTYDILSFHFIGMALIEALEHIAERNLVHRDIKPDNIMFREDGETPVIVDFGLVRDLNNQSLTQTWLLQGPGSPYYSAPEQLNNQKELIDWKTDQFALGITFSLCLLGVHPYYHKGDTQGDVVMRMIKRENCSEDYKQLCEDNGLSILKKMVEPWPIYRFRTPQLLIKAWNELIK